MKRHNIDFGLSPLNAYMKFCVNERDNVKKELENMQTTKDGKNERRSVALELAQRWKALSDDQRKKICKDAVDNRKKYKELKELLTKKNDEIHDIIDKMYEVSGRKFGKKRHYMEIFNDFVGYKCLKCEEKDEKIKSITEDMRKIKSILDE
jgi:hypothetical protein